MYLWRTCGKIFNVSVCLYQIKHIYIDNCTKKPPVATLLCIPEFIFMLFSRVRVSQKKNHCFEYSFILSCCSVIIILIHYQYFHKKVSNISFYIRDPFLQNDFFMRMIFSSVYSRSNRIKFNTNFPNVINKLYIVEYTIYILRICFFLLIFSGNSYSKYSREFDWRLAIAIGILGKLYAWSER